MEQINQLYCSTVFQFPPTAWWSLPDLVHELCANCARSKMAVNKLLILFFLSMILHAVGAGDAKDQGRNQWS